MSIAETTTREFKPGTLGWTADDLDDPEVERQWFAGRYEIIEGVLTEMPPAYFAGGAALFNLLFIVRSHVDHVRLPGSFAPEADIIVSKARIVVADAVFMSPEDQANQAREAARRRRKDPRRSRIYVPPTLVIESVSEGKELHDRETKRAWYSQFGVRHYWLLDSYARYLECLQLQGDAYVTDQLGREDEVVRPSCFPGLVVPLRDVWGDVTS